MVIFPACGELTDFGECHKNEETGACERQGNGVTLGAKKDPCVSTVACIVSIHSVFL